MKWTLIGTGFVIVVAALVLGLGTKTVSYEVTIEKPLEYRIVQVHGITEFDLTLGDISRAYVTIENIDTEPGTFVVDFTFKTLYRTLTDSRRLYIFPGETKIAQGLADIRLEEDWTWNYKVTPETKTAIETRYQEVPLYKWLFGLTD